MRLQHKDKEFDLKFTTAAYMGLKKELACKNLRKTLLSACRDEDYDVLASTIKRFSGGVLPSNNEAYDCIDAYCEMMECRKQRLFLLVVEQIGENGFFGEKKTVAELEKMLNSPEMDIDMDKLMGKVMESMESRMVEEAVQGVTTMTGATTSTTSAFQPIAAV